MKFISKHTEGPWHPLSDPIKEKTMDIRGKDGRRISVVVMDYPMGVKTMDANTKLISQAPDMLNYLIERAEFLDNFIKDTEDVVFDGGYYDLTEINKELSRLIEIIKAAGVGIIN